VISIILPVFNEEDSIVTAIESIQKLFSSQLTEFEILVVDDGSTDKTKVRVQEFLRSDVRRNIRLVEHPHNLGYGAALKTGIRESKFKYCGIMDSDSTYDPKDLLALYSLLIKDGFDMVVGSRQGKFYQGSIRKRLLRLLLRNFVEYMTGRLIPDINSGIRVFSKEKVSENSRLLSDKFSFTTSITLSFMMRNFFVAYLPVSYDNRKGETKVKLISDSFRTFGFVLSVAAYYNPLRIFFPLILVEILIALSLCIASLMVNSLVLAVCGLAFLLTGLVVFAIALLAHLLSYKLGEN
jgi:glycosyltransferase involved in cell wall biosynthesis